MSGKEPERGLPLFSRAVGLTALTAADSDGVKILEGAQGHPGDGHILRSEGDEDGLSPVEMLAKVMDNRDNQRVFSAAQTVLPWDGGGGGGVRERKKREGGPGLVGKREKIEEGLLIGQKKLNGKKEYNNA